MHSVPSSRPGEAVWRDVSWPDARARASADLLQSTTMDSRMQKFLKRTRRESPHALNTTRNAS